MTVRDLIIALLTYDGDGDVWIDGELKLPTEVARVARGVVIR